MGNKLDFEKLEKWHTTVALLGAEVDDLYSWYDRDHEFMDLLETHQRHIADMAKHGEMVRAVLLTTEMGVSYDEIDQYLSHLRDLHEEEEKAQRAERIRSSDFMQLLYNKHQFNFTTAKQYPTHKHFTFTNKSGLVIRGRAFNNRWGSVRVWLYWKDSKNKSRSLVYSMNSNDDNLKFPKGFPSDLVSKYSLYTVSPELASYIMAYRVIERKLKSGSTYPKA
jgi:hypothetical protein